MSEVVVVARARQQLVHHALAELGQESAFTGNAGVCERVGSVGFREQGTDGRLEAASLLRLVEMIEQRLRVLAVLAHPRPADERHERVSTFGQAGGIDKLDEMSLEILDMLRPSRFP
jgi:hypothetical protein